MFSIKLIKLAAIILTLAFVPSAFAQATTPSPDSAKQSPDPTVRLGLKNRVFEIKHRDPDALLSVLRLLGSPYGSMSVSDEFRTLTVRDFPENIATIDEAIKRLDTPVPAAPGIEFHIYILIAGNAAAASSNQYPSEINDVVKQLQSTLSYKNYYLMTSAVLRTREGQQGIDNKGVADFKVATEGAARNSPIFYDYGARQVSLNTTASGVPIIQIGVFNFAMRIPIETSTGQINYENIGFKSPVSVREGEKVVVGTTTMQDKGVIVVLTAKIIK